MKLKHSISNKNVSRKRIAFSAMLNSEYFFHRSSQIQMALKHERILSKDFHIKRAKSKIDMGTRKKKIANIKENNKNTESNNSQESYKEDKKDRDIPLELYFILLDYKNKFLKENIKFHSIKEYNDAVLSFWHFINKPNTKKDRLLLFKKYFPEGESNINNLYSDKVQKLSLNLFKSNPLLTYNNFSEIFFHYLSEFVQYTKDEKKMENCKQKIIKFLEKLRDYLEYVQIMQDSELDSISRDIKVKNSKFVKEYDIKAKNEMIKLKEKENIQNSNDIKDSTKMINETKNTLASIDENKKIFEDPINFDPMRSYNFNLNIVENGNIKKKQYFNKINLNNYKTPLSSSTNKIRFFSPNKTVRKSSSVSTGFILSGKAQKEGKKLLENNREEEKFEKFRSNENSNKKLSNINNYSKLTKLNTNNINNKIFKRRFSSAMLDMKMKNELIGILKSKQNTRRKESIGKNSDYSSEDKYKKITNDDKSTSRLINLSKRNKRVSFYSPIIRKKSLQKMGDISNINNILTKKTKMTKEENEKKIDDINFKKREVINMKKRFNYNKFKDPLIVLYEDIKNKQEIKKKDVDNIQKYLKSKGKSLSLNFNSMDIIKQAKRVTNKMDIEKKTKRVFHPFLNYKQIQKLDNINVLNDKVCGLDFDYIYQLFDFKSKNSESIQAQL